MLPLLPATPRRADTAAHWADRDGTDEWDPHARPADDRLMDRLDILASHGQLVDSSITIAELRAELRRTDELLQGVRRKEKIEESRAQVNEQERRRLERTLGQQVVVLQNEIAEQRYSADVAAANARDTALRQAQLLRRNAATEVTEERERHAAEMAELVSELQRVRASQAAQAHAQAAGELKVQQELSRITEARKELAEERQCASQQAQQASVECARLASESKLARERQRAIQLASIEREKETRAMVAQVEAERNKTQAELTEAREQVESELSEIRAERSAGKEQLEEEKRLQAEQAQAELAEAREQVESGLSRLRAERSAEKEQLEEEKRLRAEQMREEAAWQQKKNEGMLKTIAEYKSKIADLETAAQKQLEAKQRADASLETMLELHVEAENAWGIERSAIQQELEAANAQVAQAESQLRDQDALQQAEQLLAYAKSKHAQSSREEQVLRKKLEQLKAIALHKRALSLSEQQEEKKGDVQDRWCVDLAKIDALTQADPPLPEAEVKDKLVALLLNHHNAQADAAAAQYYASAR